MDLLIRRSVEDAFRRHPHLSSYVKRHAQEMDETVMRQHVDLYVNDHSLALGATGRRAVETLLQVWGEANPGEPAVRRDVFAPTEAA
jgi:1,4-dihydroxy-6-naphthoate synthase